MKPKSFIRNVIGEMYLTCSSLKQSLCCKVTFGVKVYDYI